MKVYNKEYTSWYGSGQISLLIKQYAPSTNVFMPAAKLLRAVKQLLQIHQGCQYFLPLNINCLSQNFEEGRNDHWACLYIGKENLQIIVIFLDPMGRDIYTKSSLKIKSFPDISEDEIWQPLLNNLIQYVQLDPFLVYCVTSIAKGEGIRQNIETLEKSVSFGQNLILRG